MEELDISRTSIKQIPILPNSLKVFACGSNKITKIENLPNSLKVFYCRDNKITKIENLPNSLQEFGYWGNEISMVDDLELSRFNGGKFNLWVYQSFKRLQRRIRLRHKRKNAAARVIQQGCYNWLYSAKCKDGKLGLMVARDIENLRQEFGMFQS